MSKKAYVLLANGFELMEALVPVDVLKRGKVETILVSMNDTLEVIASNNVAIKADKLFSCDMDGDILIIPGGYPGYENLRNDNRVKDIVTKYLDAQKDVAAICGGPTVLGVNDLIKDHNYTCHTSVISEMNSDHYVDENVVVSKNLITAKGAGISLEFALTIAKRHCDDAAYAQILKGMELK